MKQIIFCWPFTAPSGKELQMNIFADGTAELFDHESWSEANKNKRPEYKFIHYLLDERGKLPFTFKIQLPFELYCQIRRSSLDLDKGIQVTPAIARDINLKITQLVTNATKQAASCALALQHGLAPTPKPRPAGRTQQ